MNPSPWTDRTRSDRRVTIVVRHNKFNSSMSALGQKQTFREFSAMSALPPKADIGTQSWDVRFVPKGDIGRYSGERD
jgi:hypothetical protein